MRHGEELKLVNNRDIPKCKVHSTETQPVRTQACVGPGPPRMKYFTRTFYLRKKLGRKFYVVIFNGIEFTETIDIANALNEHFYCIPIQLAANVPR